MVMEILEKQREESVGVGQPLHSRIKRENEA